jgi:hypothetical protein
VECFRWVPTPRTHGTNRDTHVVSRRTIDMAVTMQVSMDASLLGVTSQRSTCSAELLSTVAALAGVSKQHTVFMTCSGALVHTAAAAEINAVVIKNSLLSRGAEFPDCAGSFDGFGAGGGATAARLISLMS